MKYEDLLEKDEWEVKRYEILARDNYTCQDCGCRKGIENIAKTKERGFLSPNLICCG